MNLYELFKYTPKEILELEYLLEQARRFNIEDKVQEGFFQFSPKLLPKENRIEGFGEHEKWSHFHKSIAASEIIFYLIEKNFKNEYVQEALIDSHIWKHSYVDFMNKNDLRELTNEEINKIFIKFTTEKEELKELL